MQRHGWTMVCLFQNQLLGTNFAGPHTKGQFSNAENVPIWWRHHVTNTWKCLGAGVNHSPLCDGPLLGLGF